LNTTPFFSKVRAPFYFSVPVSFPDDRFESQKIEACFWSDSWFIKSGQSKSTTFNKSMN